MKKLFLSVAALFAVCIVSAQEGVVASYNKGAEMLQSKNYPEAAKLFQKVMQSKKALGLYFAGEVLDVDAYTGGYNLQIAFCTAQSFANNL